MQLRRSVLEEATRLTNQVGRELPIDLARVASCRAIRKIEFRPLLVDGGLAVVDDGFHVFVRCEPNEAEHLNHLFSEDGTGRTLPITIAKQARFTIAHEIAHTFLYDIQAMPPRSFISVKRGVQVNALEHTCNDAASALLLPEAAIAREFRDSTHLLDPEKLRRFSDKAMISRPAFVFRLGHLRSYGLPIGIIASARKENDEWQLTAITRHYALRDVYPQAKVGKPLSNLLQHHMTTLTSGQSREERLDSDVGQFICTAESAGSRREQRSCFITLSRI